jgi:hypothetical protein
MGYMEKKKKEDWLMFSQANQKKEKTQVIKLELKKRILQQILLIDH